MNKLNSKIKEQYPKITYNQVKDYLETSSTAQLHTKKQRPKEEANIYGQVGQYQLDLTFLSQYKRQNSNFHIILVAVEINTRYAYAIALKSKSQDSLVDALEKRIKKMIIDKRNPTIFQTDNGTEFKNAKVAKLCHEYNIKQIYCQEGDKKCLAMAERFNRTIKGLLNKYMTQNNTTRWVDVLNAFVNNYNNTVHSMLGVTPKSVTRQEEGLIISEAMEHNYRIKQNNNIKVGDKVRLPLSKSKFEKEGKNFSDEVYTVNRVLLTNLTVDGKTKKYRISEVLKVPPSSVEVNTENIKQAKKTDRVRRIVEEKEGLQVDHSNENVRVSNPRVSKLKAYERL